MCSFLIEKSDLDTWENINMTEKNKKWIDRNITVNLKNKNVFITGANSGLGYELAKQCAYLGANVFMLVRNKQRGENAVKDILASYPNAKLNLLDLDLADFNSIENSANKIKEYDVDIFVNNAGVFRLPYSKTKNDLEITMGTNFIGTLYLNDLLQDYFGSLNHKVRVLFTGSLACLISRLNYNDFFSTKHYRLMKVYARSKIATHNMFFDFKENCKYKNIIFSLTHPGATYTPLISKGFTNKYFLPIGRAFMKLFFHTPEKAALTSLYAIEHEDVSVVGPRGFFEFSGYPHKSFFKKHKDFHKCTELGREIIKTHKYIK